MSNLLSQHELDSQFNNVLRNKVKQALATSRKQLEKGEEIKDLLPINSLLTKASVYKFGSAESAIQYLRTINESWQASQKKSSSNAKRDAAFIELILAVVELVPERDLIAKKFLSHLRAGDLKNQLQNLLMSRSKIGIPALSIDTSAVQGLSAPKAANIANGNGYRQRRIPSPISRSQAFIRRAQKSSLTATQIQKGASLQGDKSLTAEVYKELVNIRNQHIAAREVINCHRALNHHLDLVEKDVEHATGYELGKFSQLINSVRQQGFVATSALHKNILTTLALLDESQNKVLDSQEEKLSCLRVSIVLKIYTNLRYKGFSHQALNT